MNSTGAIDYKILYEQQLSLTTELEFKVSALTHQLDQPRKMIFGSKSERFIPSATPGVTQGVLFDEEPGRGESCAVVAIKEVTTYINTTYITSDTLIQFLKQLKERCGDKPIALILDKARYQHCFAVKTFTDGLGIHLLYLPPYSPNLNIIERLWKFIKRKILYGKYYNKPAEFHQAIQNFFANVNRQYANELKSLLSLKFQFFDNPNPLIYSL